MGNLSISSNKKYILEDEKPFLWIGDTAWLMLQKLNLEDTKLYLRNRKEKGFNVIQTVLVHTIKGVSESGCSLAPGIKDVTTAQYWNHVDKVLDLAQELGLYVALLPSWGSLVKDEVINESNVGEYASFLGERFQKRKNIIWILGGDVRGNIHPEIFKKEAQILKQYNPERLMTFHPFGRTSSSLWFQDEEWLDFNLYQSGHRRYDQATLGEWDDNAKAEEFFGEDNWKYVEKDLTAYTHTKPTIDGEPSYEGIPKGLHNPRNGFWEEWDTRRYAYWSVLAGGAGHTYGSNAIMQFYSNGEKGAYGVREDWKDALHHPGSGQMLHLKNLMMSVDFINGKANDKLLLYGQKERYHRVACFAGEDYIICYTYEGDEILLNLEAYADKKMDAYWMNPQDGSYSYITTLENTNKWLASPVRRKDIANDWVLVIKKVE